MYGRLYQYLPPGCRRPDTPRPRRSPSNPGLRQAGLRPAPGRRLEPRPAPGRPRAVGGRKPGAGDGV